MTRILIDSSAWIHFLRNSDVEVADAVERAILDDRAVITGPVVAELLQGIRDDGQATELRELLAIVDREEVIPNDWNVCGQTMRSLRSRGVTVPLTDALIATVAVRCDIPVLTVDAHFRQLPAALAQT
jgi:predicted nucleic acid-binding protein